MVSAGILLIIPNAMIAYRIAEARRHDYSESGIWVYTEIPRPLT